jgi:hypothetical protein
MANSTKRRRGGRLSPQHPQRLKERLETLQMIDMRIREDATWEQIGKAFGYAGRSGPSNAVRRLMAAEESEARDLVRTRLDALLDLQEEALIPALVGRSHPVRIKASDALTRVGKRRSDLHGADAPAKAPVDGKGNAVPVINLTLDRGSDQPPTAP